MVVRVMASRLDQPPALQLWRNERAPNSSARWRARAIGGTPMEAPETVGIPFSIESFRLSGVQLGFNQSGF
jgi:hypothetical protein